MLEVLIGNDSAVIPLLLLFITGLLTKRIVPWYVHEEVLKKLKEYEDAAPGLIDEVNRLVKIIEESPMIESRARPRTNPRVIKETSHA